MKKLSGNWQQDPVAEFFEHLNWLGIMPADTPVLEPMVINWQALKVSDFWQRVNWLGIVTTAPPAPTSPAQWRQYHVKDFFGRMNWQGIGVMLPVGEASTAAAASEAPPTAWPAWSVDTFFSQLNWEGRPDQAVALEPGVSLWRLSVSDFCAGIAWTGQPVIAHVRTPEAPPPPPAEPEFTLSDLSSLF
ncbi:hypothetical protein RYO59_000875 [Thermosynechococcaceae cyanobacterium Okahandja]